MTAADGSRAEGGAADEPLEGGVADEPLEGGAADEPLQGDRATRSGAAAEPAPARSIDFCGVPLAGPVFNGSGTFDVIAARRAFGDALIERFPFDAFVSKTITLAPRQGNPPPRLWETPAGLINSIGLPNKGLDRFLDSDLPEITEILTGAGEVPLVVSVMGFSRDELAILVGAAGRRDEVAMVELNVSCPNVETGLVIGADPDETALAVERVRAETTKPVIVKLAPNTPDPARVAVAAQEAGADAVSLINTLKGMALHPHTGEHWLGGRTGGVSGPAIRAIALQQVAAAAEAVRIPVIGMGGIASGRHARDFLTAGASAIAVGTESFRDPAAGRRIAGELAELSLSGASHAPASTLGRTRLGDMEAAFPRTMREVSGPRP